MKSTDIESLLSSELEEVKGGSTGTCVCEHGGAGETVIVVQPPPPVPSTPGPTSPV